MAAVMAAIFLASAAALVYLRTHRPTEAVREPDPGEPSLAAQSLKIPPFRLTTQSGGTFSEKDLIGHITIIDFIFTHCPFICPTLGERMGELAATLKGTDVRFLSFSVDPAHDTPETLKDYATKHKADLSRWTFGVGSPETVKAVIREGLNFIVEDDKATPITLPDGSTMSNIVHPSWFLLVGADGRALGVYMSSNPEDLAALAARAQTLDARLKTRK